MSERDGEADALGCLFRAAGMLIGAILMLVIANWITGAIEKRDNQIRDLQRRVGQLETQK